MIFKTMLNKNDLEKINVYKLLISLPQGTYSKNKLMGEFAFSYNRFCVIIEEINKDIQYLSKKQSEIMNSGKICLCSNLFPLDIYATYLLKQSISYRFLMALLLEEEKTLEEFCAKNQVSVSYTRRSIKDFVSFLSEYNLSINISAMQLNGDERIIRILLNFLIWSCTFGDEFMPSSFTPEQIDAALNPILSSPPKTTSPYIDKQRRIHVEILYRRIKNGHIVEDDPNYDIFLKGNYTDCFEPLQKLLGLNKNDGITEARFLGFMAFYGPTYSFEDDPLFDIPREELGVRSLTIEKFLLLFRKEILSPVLSDYPNIGRLMLLEANVVNIFFNYLIFQQKIPYFTMLQREELKEKDTDIFKIILEKIQEMFRSHFQKEQEKWINDCMEQMSMMLTFLILPSLKEHQKTIKLNVAILSEDNYIYINNVKSLLADLSFVELLPYTVENKEKIDLLIYPSKVFQQEEEKAQTITLPFASLKEDFFDVYKKIKLIYEEKLRSHFINIGNR